MSLETLERLATDASLIGRDIVIEESGTVQRGPIKEIKIVDSMLRVTVGWLAILEGFGGRSSWRLSLDEPFTYTGNTLNWSYAHEQPDGSIRIAVPMVWSGTILSDDEERLAKPAA